MEKTRKRVRELIESESKRRKKKQYKIEICILKTHCAEMVENVIENSM